MSGNAQVSGDAKVYGVKLSKTSDYILIGPIGSRDSFLTLTRETATTGCFNGSWKELIQKSGDRKYTIQYKAALHMAKAHFEMIDGK